MLWPFLMKDCSIARVERKDDCLYLYSDRGLHRLAPMSDKSVRITYTEREDFSSREKPGVVAKQAAGNWQYTEDEKYITLSMPALKILIDRQSASYTYYDSEGKLLLQEKERESKTLEEFQSYKLAEGVEAKVEKIQTADGVKEIVRDAAKVPDEKFYHTRLYLKWQEKEALYGLGQHEEGFMNLRGQTVYIHQANKKIAVPMLVSSLGYGILMDTYSPMIFSDTVYGSYLYTEADDEIDFYFVNGGSMEGVVKEYRFLTGKAAMLPKWAFGYIQSQERFETAEELINVSKEYRERGIGLDCIVLDWMSWPDNLWGQKTFDKNRFPDPTELMNTLHDMNVHFMISLWPTMDEKSDNYREFKENNLFLPSSNVYNALSKEGRKLYWKQVNEGLFTHGVDSWWCDSSEPYTPDWNHKEKPEPGLLFAEYCQMVQNHLPAWATNAYALYHAQALYEGQRGAQRELPKEKRVVNLTRSSYTGQQRYGTILWSGDIDASWDTYKKQIATGLNFCASGLPYWTVDIGAFFVKRGVQWYWKGDYPTATQDLGYRELFTRWYQWACFLPVFRGHGTDCRRELWQFGDKGEMFYDAMVETNKLRYTLMPYIYSQAGRVWLEDVSMMKMLAFDFSEDEQALNIEDQYLFGESIMVCPVTEPMYYEAGSVPLKDTCKQRKVYLPKGCGWYDYHTNAYYEGGQWICVEAPLEKIPLFVKAGSILPVTQAAGCVGSGYLDETKVTYRVYAGGDCSYLLYEDAGDGYGYEQGEYRTTRLDWKEETGVLTAVCVHDNSAATGTKSEVIMESSKIQIIRP